MASAGGIAVRLAAGRLADRHRHLLPIALSGSMLLGGVGTLALAITPRLDVDAAITIFGVAMCVAVAAGWGWTGLGFVALTDASPDAPGYAASAGMLGLSAGGTGGPLLFGLLVARTSNDQGWGALAALFVLAALLARRAATPAG